MMGEKLIGDFVFFCEILGGICCCLRESLKNLWKFNSQKDSVY